MAKADPKHGHALARLGIGPAESAINRVTGAEDRGCLLVGDLVGNEIGGVGIHQHVLGVTALCINSFNSGQNILRLRWHHSQRPQVD